MDLLTENETFSQMIQAGMSQEQINAAAASLSVLAAGFAPKLKSVVWGVFGYSIFVSYLGRLLKFPEIMEKLTPFGYIAQMPIQEFKLLPVAVFSVMAIVFIGAGLIGYRKRDIQ